MTENLHWPPNLWLPTMGPVPAQHWVWCVMRFNHHPNHETSQPDIPPKEERPQQLLPTNAKDISDSWACLQSKAPQGHTVPAEAPSAHLPVTQAAHTHHTARHCPGASRTGITPELTSWPIPSSDWAEGHSCQQCVQRGKQLWLAGTDLKLCLFHKAFVWTSCSLKREEVWRVFLYSSRTTGEQLWLLLIFCCVPTCCVARGAAASCSNALCCFLLYQFQSTPAVSGFILFFFSLKEKQPPTCSLTLSYRTLFFLFSGLVLPRGDQSFSLPRHALRHLLCFVGWGWSCFCEQCSRGPCLYSHLILSFWLIWWLSHTDASCFFSHI